MIVLDTNVVSELMREHPNARVDAWAASRDRREMSITSVTIAEVLYGIRLLPVGRRRQDLHDDWLSFMTRGFGDTVLPFDAPAADIYTQIAFDRRRSGRPVDAFDGMIAAIARLYGAAVATRDTADFRDCGVELINPWNE